MSNEQYSRLPTLGKDEEWSVLDPNDTSDSEEEECRASQKGKSTNRHETDSDKDEDKVALLSDFNEEALCSMQEGGQVSPSQASKNTVTPNLDGESFDANETTMSHAVEHPLQPSEEDSPPCTAPETNVSSNSDSENGNNDVVIDMEPEPLTSHCEESSASAKAPVIVVTPPATEFVSTHTPTAAAPSSASSLAPPVDNFTSRPAVAAPTFRRVTASTPTTTSTTRMPMYE